MYLAEHVEVETAKVWELSEKDRKYKHLVPRRDLEYRNSFRKFSISGLDREVIL